jgi:hypothetical protein
MARLYRMYFRNVEKEFSPEKKYTRKKAKTGTDTKIYLSADESITVLEKEIAQYWDCGDGPLRIEFAGELDDAYLKPILSEPDFVDDQIKSKKNGETIGYQG